MYKKAVVFIAILGLFLLQSTAACDGCNTPPTKPDVKILPIQPDEKDDLFCYAHSTDYEGDTITYIYKWYRNNSLFRTYTTTKGYTVISSAYTEAGDNWKCVVKAFDGKAYSSEALAEVHIESSLYECDSFEISLPESYVHLGTNDETEINVRIKNKVSQTNCIRLSTENSNPRINVWLRYASVCLEGNETKYIKLHIETHNASVGNYDILIKASNGCITKSASVHINVQECHGICPKHKGVLLEPESIDVCKNNSAYLSVKIINNTSKCVTLKLGISSSDIPMSFTKDTVQLCAYEETHATLKVFAGSSTGTKCGKIYAYEICDGCDGYYAIANVCVNVKECMPEYGKAIAVIAPESCTKIEKGKTVAVGFKVKNLLCELQKVRIEVLGDIKATVDKSSEILLPNEEKQFYLKVTPSADVTPGKHYIKVYAISEKGRDKKEICIEVLPTHKIEIELENPQQTIRQCSFGVYNLRITNKGDSTEKLCINANNPTDAKVEISERCIQLSPKESKEVFITVNVPESMQPGSYAIDLLIEDGNVWRKTMYFDVVESLPKEEGKEISEKQPARILSYPEYIRINPGERLELKVVIFNYEDVPIETTLSLETPDELSSETRIVRVPSNNYIETTIPVIASESAKSGIYDAFLRLSYNGMEDVKHIRVEIAGQISKETGMASTMALPLAVFFIILAFIILVIILKALT